MGVIIPNGFGLANIVLSGTVGTPEFVTTIGVDVTDVGADLVEAANKVMQAYADVFIPSTTSNLSLDRVVLQVAAPGPGTGSVESDLASFNGAQGGDMAPMATSAILRKTTSVLGRRGRGRMFLPGVVRDADVDINGRLTNVFQAGLTGQGADFLDLLRSGDGPGPMDPYLLHSTGDLPTPIEALICGPLVGLLRYRIR